MAREIILTHIDKDYERDFVKGPFIIIRVVKKEADKIVT